MSRWRARALDLWSAIYRLAEAEPALAAGFPALARRLAADWPLPQTLALDVGASLGVYARAFSRWAPLTLAVEPNPAMARHLRALALPRVEVIEAAASDHAGEARLADRSPRGWRRPEARVVAPRTGDAPAWSHPCRLLRLDSLAATLPQPPLALVAKFDIEGGELAALRGMGRLLELPHILLIVEIEARHTPEPGAVFDLLARAGLDAFTWIPGRMCGLEPSGLADLPPPGRHGGRLARLRGYRNNFVFARFGR